MKHVDVNWFLVLVVLNLWVLLLYCFELISVEVQELMHLVIEASSILQILVCHISWCLNLEPYCFNLFSCLR
jgi:hypothetical protein